MADRGTRKTTTDRLEEALARLTLHHEALAAQHSDLASKVSILLDKFNQPPPNSAPLTPAIPKPHIKLEVPRFDGRDPLGWIFKISQFFLLSSNPRGRTYYLSILLPRRSGTELVPVVLPQRVYHLVVGLSPSSRDPFRSNSLRRPSRCFIQAHPAWLHQ